MPCVRYDVSHDTKCLRIQIAATPVKGGCSQYKTPSSSCSAISCRRAMVGAQLSDLITAWVWTPELKKSRLKVMHHHSSDCKAIVDESGLGDADQCMHPRTPQLLEKTASGPKCAALQHLYQALPRHPAHNPAADSSKARPSLSAQQRTDFNLRMQQHLFEHMLLVDT